MKTITVIGAKMCTDQGSALNPRLTDLTIEGPDDMSVSDGYHTMDELYEHRIALWIAHCKLYSKLERALGEKDLAEGRVPIPKQVWRSKNHSDGEPAFGGGWFVLGLGRVKGGQLTYHLPIEKWEETGFAVTLPKAPEFDGHTSADVLERLRKL